MKSSWTGSRYTSPDIFEQERARIFERSWLCVSRADELREPGSFRRVERAEIGGEHGESVLLVRARDGVLRGFVNLCRRSGAQWCAERQGTLGKTLSRMYLDRAHGRDRRFVSAPYASDCAVYTDAARNVLPVATEEWLGYVWMKVAPDPAPLTEQMEPQLRRRFGDTDMLEPYGMDELTTVTSRVYDVRANWKVILENFSGPGARGARLSLWPNTVLVLLPDHVACLRLEPLAADHTRMVADWLFHPEAAAAPGFAAQDSPREHGIAEFHRWVDEALDRELT
jgi:Rieske 2Fe-2S family protein